MELFSESQVSTIGGDLAQYEAVIEHGLKTFVDVGNALRAIRDERLYEQTEYKSFALYCIIRWGFEHSYATKLIKASIVTRNIEDHGPHIGSPKTERQARPLAKLEPAQQREAWQQAVETAPNNKPTSEHVKKIVTEMIREKKPAPVLVLPAQRSPRLIVARAESMPQIVDESIDLIITSPPYNLGESNWPMGGDGNTPRLDGIGYSDLIEESKYQEWQVDCLVEIWRIAKQGASLFYNHKARNQSGQIIHPMDWLRDKRNPWTIRQEIIWDRGSTHNHSPTLFWPEDERIYWMTKGIPPRLPARPIGASTVWRFHGPVANTWHPAPFAEELPRRCIDAIGEDGVAITVLDPFAGSCTTLKVALEYGYDAIGVDISQEYLNQAAMENGWTTKSEN